MMVAVPPLIPVTVPVLLPTIAVVGAPLLQEPPASGSVNVVVDPTHIVALPLMADGSGFTVTTAVAVQPKGNV